MRISDWSSDVCSSDLVEALLRSCGAPDAGWSRLSYRQAFERDAGFDPHALSADQLRSRLQDRRVQEPEHLSNDELADRDFWSRSAERRAGKKGVSKCRTRWSR